MLSSALSFSLMVVCVRQAGHHIPLSGLVLARVAVGLPLSWWMLRRAGIPPLGRHHGLLALRGLIGTAALYCVYGGVTRLPMATATVLQYLYPTLTAALAWLLLGEAVGARLGLAMGLGWLGVATIAGPGLPGAWSGGSAGAVQLEPQGIVLALAGAVLTALAYVTVRSLRGREHPLVIVLWFPLMALPLSLPLVLLDPVLPSAGELGWLAGVGLFTQLGQIGLTRGLTGLPAARATAISYAQVAFAALWGWLIFAETPDLRSAIGASLVLSATLLSQ